MPRRYSTNSNGSIKGLRASVFFGKGDAGREVLTIFGGCLFAREKFPGGEMIRKFFAICLIEKYISDAGVRS